MKSILKKIPWWCWVFLPVALVILVVWFFRRGSGPGWLGYPSETDRPGAATHVVTPERGEEIKEEIREKAAAEVKKIEAEQDEIKKKADDLRDLLK